MKTILSTKRLSLREFETTDWEFVIELLNTSSWLNFIGDRNVQNKADAEQYIEKLRAAYHDFGYGFYLVELKANPNAIGMCGLTKREHLALPDIGFAFLPLHQGFGYGFEAASATVDYAKMKLQLEKICAITTTDNVRSIKLLRKIGLHFQKNIFYEDEELMLFEN